MSHPGNSLSAATLLLISLTLSSASVSEAHATDVSRAQAISAAKRDLEAAQLELKLYRNVEFPLRMRRLKSEIKLVKAELDWLERRVENFERRIRKHNSDPRFHAFFHAMEKDRLAALKTKLRLKELREERLLLCKFDKDHRRLHELKVDAALDTLKALQSAI